LLLPLDDGRLGVLVEATTGQHKYFVIEKDAKDEDYCQGSPLRDPYFVLVQVALVTPCVHY